MFPIFAGNSASTGYNLTRSLRTRASATPWLNRTFAAGNQKTWTLSTWVKRGTLGSAQVLLSTGVLNTSDSTFANFGFTATDQLTFTAYTVAWRTTTQVFRDPSSWYHIVLAFDTTQATAANRVKLYVNGAQVTAFASSGDPTINTDYAFNQAAAHYLGYPATSYSYFDGYKAETYFINGQQLTPSSFGSTNSTTGVWQPAAYTGTYGTNGFYLNFTDNSALTTSSNVGLGKDFSGNANYWVTNNISITAGVTYDSMTDVPTLTSATAANFPVLNTLVPNPNGTPTYSNANLSVNCASASNFTAVPATMLLPTTGKWYAEFYAVYGDGTTSILDMGLLGSTDFPTASGVIGTGATSYGYRANGNKLNNNVGTAYGATYTTGDLIAIAFDATAGSLTFYKNNTSQGVAFTGLTAQYFFAVGGYNFAQWACNFGQRPFTYTPPSGFVALNTYNLPTSTIVKGNTVMDATLWTGDGTSPRTITNAALFQPDLVWFKTRSTAFYNQLSDSVRGATKSIYSNVTLAEENNAINGYLSSINSNGFSVINGSTGGGSVNANSTTYVAWQWQAGQGSTSSNTNGTITSTVSVNASAGFSVVTYTGNGTSGATLGHGLGVAPQLIFIKSRSATGYWLVYSAVNGATKYLTLNTTDAVLTNAGPFNNTAPTSSVFSVGNSADANANSTTYVAYCWTPIAGFSAFGSYTGNGSTDGPFVYLGFRPKFVLVKNTGLASNWAIFDSTRNPYNITNFGLVPNLSDAETSGSSLQLLSNGFKWTDAGTTVNQSGATLIYMAFAENPFRNSLAR